MKLTSILVVFVFAFSVLVITGCKESGQEQDVTAVSEAEAQAQAEQEITEENLDEQLEQIERELDADTNEGAL